MDGKQLRRTARPLPMSEVPSWTDEADVVVVGFGVAGAAAAVEAAAAGADVIALDRTSGWGGAAAMAGGFIYLGGGTALQQACGFEDSPDDMYAFMKAAFGSEANDQKLAVYADASVDHFDWLVSCGVPFKAAFYDQPGWEAPGDEGLMFSGGENAHPFADVIRPAPRGHIPLLHDKVGDRGAGYMLVKPLVDTALASGVRLKSDSRFERLVVDQDGRVRGVLVTSFGQQVLVRARRGVVLATGSFAYSDDLVTQYVPALSGRPGASVEEHDGQAMRAAQWLGADLAHMDACEGAIFVDPGLMARGVVINSLGQRYINEDTYPGRIGHATVVRQKNEAFVVADEQAINEATAACRANPFTVPAPNWASDDLAELERDAGLPEGSLTATMDYYNKYARDSRDPQFHKASRWVRPMEGPLGIFDLRGQTSGFPVGGLQTSVDGAVLTVDGDETPGLFAAGRTTLGIAAMGYASGCSLGDGSFFGRRAGRAAASVH